MRHLATLLPLIALLALALPATASAHEPWISEAKATAIAERHGCDRWMGIHLNGP